MTNKFDLEILKLNIGVILGGRSAEREISLESGKIVARALREIGFNKVYEIEGDKNLIESLKNKQIDLAFIVLHGPLGEDGTIQGMLEFMDLPYTGSDVLASALAMDKVKSKIVFKYHKILTPDWFSFNKEEYLEKKIDYLEKCLKKKKLNYPLMVKPNSQGSTIGMNKVNSKIELEKAVDEALRYSSVILIEEYLKGKEISVPVLGINPFPLPVIEIAHEEEFYTYEVKYHSKKSTHIIPAELPKNIYKKAQKLAVLTHKVLGCFEISRVDMIVLEDGKIYVLELNTIPGMTYSSLLPDSAVCAGISFNDLIYNLIVWALERKFKNNKKNKNVEAKVN
ncbi:MAG: D-alanine--D-alanine ligase [Armatimonadetes bacterium]|nr:D-alanine--D-alanine ligase [Armatimonadota bacterium]